jgi:hypothetical protein
MHGVIKGVYYCQDNRVQDLNVRISNRNIPSKTLQMTFDPRQVQTRYVRFPMIDCYMPSKEPIKYQSPYNQHLQFNPGTSAPYSGYATNIDQDSRLQNIFMPNQKWTAQTEFIPSSHSDLYNTPKITTSNPVKMTNQGLFKTEQFSPFNPNPCNLGSNVFYNFTRQQVKNLPVTK